MRTIQEILRRTYDYNKRTGEFTNRRSGRKAFKGKTSNGVGYAGQIVLDDDSRLTIRASRAAYIYVHGDISEDDFVIHIDNNAKNNRIDNLEIVDKAEARKVRHKLNKNNEQGVRGVCAASPSAFNEGYEAYYVDPLGNRYTKFFNNFKQAVEWRQQQQKRFYPYSKL